ncbi:hypothetical protein L6164_028488 [Bauhinia variegata]|uniref:Uncharacterized protein n=1 Tax=Bauhinia variegata TaxID=167791 RepID=A0ACB9L6U8_BAUVA|nr:hypothetical protein L6164_028488 [Bauhinia variegata]
MFQGIYTFDRENSSMQVDTLCVHVGRDGYITGIRGKDTPNPGPEFIEKYKAYPAKIKDAPQDFEVRSSS